MAGETTYSLLTSFGNKVVDALGRSLDRKKDTTGELRDSIRFQIKILGNRMVFQLLLADYYKWVDEGRKKGKGIPVNVLKSWLTYPGTLEKIGAKGAGIYAASKRNKSKKGLIAINRSKINSLSYIINKKIREKGIKPTHFYSKVVNKDLVNELKKNLIEATKKDVLVTITK